MAYHGRWLQKCLNYKPVRAWFAGVGTTRFILLALLALVIVSLFMHYYISKFVGTVDTATDLQRRIQLDDIHVLEDLKLRIEEFLRIKLSVSSELRDLEKKRQRLQAEIFTLTQSVEESKRGYTKNRLELDRIKLSLKQAAYAREELENRNIPLLRPPLKLLTGEDAHQLYLPTPEPPECQMHSCFDYSRCSLTSGFPVYFYPTDDSVLELNVRASLAQILDTNVHTTFDPSAACVYVVILGGHLPSWSVASYLRQLAHWNGSGRNHIVINLGSTTILNEKHVQRAIVVQSSAGAVTFRRKFDITITPPPLGKELAHPWESAPVILPARRRYLLSFQGRLAHDTNITLAARANEMIVNVLSKMLQGFDNELNFTFGCLAAENASSVPNDWLLCGNHFSRAQLLRESTFSIVFAPPADYVSTATFLVRIRESLQNGAIPVILGGDAVELPFSEFVDWSRAALLLPLARVTEVHFILRTYLDADIVELRRRGRLLWENYLSTTSRMINTVLSLVRTRLGIPAPPSHEEPSPSVFNSTFHPLTIEAAPNTETDEMLGPIEPPFPSLTYQRNFSITLNDQAKVWNEDFDPHTMYPYGVQEPILPSEAKFMGSSFGFRPVAQGAGGSGKEFGEVLGGNVPREQFTVVMLTYEREAVLIDSLQRLHSLPHLNKVIVVWNSLKPPSSDLRWPDIGVPIEVVRAKKNSLNNRFLPFSSIETEAVLSVDDDTHLRHDEIVFGFRVWREARDRIVGFPGRYHAWDINHKSWYYNSNYSCELSMVLMGAAFFHKYYSYVYTYVMPQAIRDKVDEYMNCEDIAMNFLVSHITRKPPLKVTTRWTFRCPGCTVSLSADDSHFHERDTCLNFFVKVYGYMPLLYTQFRLDSILFKTRIPHDRQKCFKFI
ncbi:exostosin like glycosyltransferase 3 [Dermacentor variabilis]|uniref:exostosin like glycosyltransferase 3 n=1 Tax=Dermacentor variabilis TaxID=34621 RepID=UPI003F5C5B29